MSENSEKPEVVEKPVQEDETVVVSNPSDDPVVEQKESKPHPKQIVTRAIMIAAALVVILAGIASAQTLITPLIMSAFFAIILMPPLLWLKNKGVPDMAAIGILGAVVLLCGIIVIGIIASTVNQFVGKIPDYQVKFQKYAEWIESIPEKIEAMIGFEETEEEGQTNENNGETDSEPATVAQDVPNEPGKKNGDGSVLGSFFSMDNITPMAQMFSRELTNLASVTFVVVVTVIFMLLEAAVITKKIDFAFGNREPNKKLVQIGEQVWKYMVIKTWISLLTGILTGLFLMFLGIEYALLWGLLAFLFNYIPNIGSIVASIPPILLALFDYNFGTAIAVTVGLITINFSVGYGLEPKFLGEGLGLSSLVVLLSLIFWGWFLGPVGMFLSAPLTMIIKIISMTFEETKWLAVLLSDRIPDSIENSERDA